MLLNRNGLLGPGMGKGGSSQRRASAGVELPPGTPYSFLDFTDPSVMFTTEGQATNVSVDGNDCASINDKGTFAGVFDTSTGSTNAPRYTTGVLNGFSGVQFDAANTEGLVSTSNLDLTQELAWLLVGFVHGNPSGTGDVFQPSDDSSGQVRATATSILSNTPDFEAQQIAAHSGGPIGFAVWCILNSPSHEISLNILAGTASSSAAFADPAAAPGSVGVENDGSTNFLDNFSVCQSVIWLGSGKPTQAQMEAYVTSKFGLAWA